MKLVSLWMTVFILAAVGKGSSTTFIVSKPVLYSMCYRFPLISLFQGLLFTVFLIGVLQFGLGQCDVWTQFDVWTQAK